MLLAMALDDDVAEVSFADLGGRVLLIMAAEIEARAVFKAFGSAHTVGSRAGYSVSPWVRVDLDARWSLLITGIGKVNAAGALAWLLAKCPAEFDAAINIGIAGVLPHSGNRGPLPIGAAVFAKPSVYGDEGVRTPTAFKTCADLGFGIGGERFPGPNVPVLARLREVRDSVDVAGPVATVSSCSGTDAEADEIVRRTGALAEGMEGAALAHVAFLMGIPLAEVRVISNTTGDRDRQRWDVPRALVRLTDLVRSWREATGGTGAGAVID
jgi:futalosine hydrolase